MIKAGPRNHTKAAAPPAQSEFATGARVIEKVTPNNGTCDDFINFGESDLNTIPICLRRDLAQSPG